MEQKDQLQGPTEHLFSLLLHLLHASFSYISAQYIYRMRVWIWAGSGSDAGASGRTAPRRVGERSGPRSIGFGAGRGVAPVDGAACDDKDAPPPLGAPVLGAPLGAPPLGAPRPARRVASSV